MPATKKPWVALINKLVTGLFKKNGRVSAYRITLFITLAVLGWGLLDGWVQWVILGDGVPGGFLGTLCTFLARWALLGWCAGVLFWPWTPDKDDLACGSIVPPLFICLIGTFVQAACIHDIFTSAPRTTYYATVSCEHCEAKCNAEVKIGESWTDWPGVTCCRCGITVLPEKVLEYEQTKAAWDARIVEDCK